MEAVHWKSPEETKSWVDSTMEAVHWKSPEETRSWADSTMEAGWMMSMADLTMEAGCRSWCCPRGPGRSGSRCWPGRAFPPSPCRPSWASRLQRREPVPGSPRAGRVPGRARLPRERVRLPRGQARLPPVHSAPRPTRERPAAARPFRCPWPRANPNPGQARRLHRNRTTPRMPRPNRGRLTRISTTSSVCDPFPEGQRWGCRAFGGTTGFGCSLHPTGPGIIMTNPPGL